jgi:hypothetical protein
VIASAKLPRVTFANLSRSLPCATQNRYIADPVVHSGFKFHRLPFSIVYTTNIPVVYCSQTRLARGPETLMGGSGILFGDVRDQGKDSCSCKHKSLALEMRLAER